MDTLGTFVRCWWVGGNFTDFPEGTWGRFIKVVTGAEEARSLTMNSVIGAPVVFRVDQVAMVMLSDPDARAAAYERERMWNEEAKGQEAPEWT